MAEDLKMLIDGQWVDAVDGSRFDVFNPATGEVVATVPSAQPADAERAVEGRPAHVRRRRVVAEDHRPVSAGASC